jgi:signal transduction histidine kinase
MAVLQGTEVVDFSEIQPESEARTGGRGTKGARASKLDARQPAAAHQEVDRSLAIEQEVRAETDGLLLVRTRIMLAMIAAGVASGLATDIYLGRFHEHPSRVLLQLVGLCSFLGLMQAVPRLSRHVSARLLAFVAASSPCLLLVIFAKEALSATEHVNLYGYMVIMVGTAILLPWGIWAQVALNGVVVASILIGVLTVGEGGLPDTGAIPPVVVAIGLSHFVALVLERNRLMLVRQRHELAAERELAEQRRLRAEALARDLDAYAHTVAHDLKNPIFVIAGYNDLLQAELAGNVSETAQEFLEATGNGCEKMTEIINELLLLASVRKTADVAREPLDMGHILAEARKRLAYKIDESRAEITMPDSWPRAIGYAPWVEAIWANYISNAIKYGGSPPRVELGADRNGSKVYFWVRDNGQGLNEDQLSTLFEEFSRADPAKAEGHGLGLSIVSRIVERLGGEVKVTSKVGEGSTFGFTLPT